MKLTQKRLKTILHYDPDTGIFTNLVQRRGRKGAIGDESGCGCNCYIVIGIDYKQYYAHMLAFLYMEGYIPKNDIDHKNRIKNDNRWHNLREASHQCNMRNRGLRTNNISGVTGVSRKKRKWLASIQVDKKGIYLGLFTHFRDAVLARWKAEVKYGYPNCCIDSSAYLYLQNNPLPKLKKKIAEK